MAIGARVNGGNGSDAGHVRIYEWSGSAWLQKGLDIDGEAAGDYSGYSVSLSSDGNTVAIGAILNNGNGSDAGHVRIYEWSGLEWTQKGIDIDGEAIIDYSGFSVNFSPDGTTVAIGAWKNDGNGLDAGHVRVYSFDGVAVVENNFGSTLVVYPNPTNGSVFVDLGSTYPFILTKTLDVKGQVISAKEFSNARQLNLEIKGVSGYYCIELVAEGNKKATIRIYKD